MTKPKQKEIPEVTGKDSKLRKLANAFLDQKGVIEVENAKMDRIREELMQQMKLEKKDSFKMPSENERTHVFKIVKEDEKLTVIKEKKTVINA